MKHINKNIWCCFLLIFGIAAFSSCEKMDSSYAEFLDGGEKIYSGRPDSLHAVAGKGRIKLVWDLIADPKIVKCKVFWNNKKDSVEVPVEGLVGRERFGVVIPNLTEGTYTFEVYSYDSKGNTSIKIEAIGNAYGDNFEASIFNRPLDSAVYVVDSKKLAVTWFGANAQAVVLDLVYTDLANKEKTLHITKVPNPLNPSRPKIWAITDSIADYKRGTPIKYRTGYQPEVNSLDTFFTAYTSVSNIKEVYAGPPPPPDPENLALGKATDKSSDVSAGRVTNIVDGNPATFWQASSGDRDDLNTWVQVDLGSPLSFERVVTNWFKAHGSVTKYEILYSDDKTTWRTAFTKTGGLTQIDIATFPKVTARYVRLNLTISTTSANINLGELEVWNR